MKTLIVTLALLATFGTLSFVCRTHATRADGSDPMPLCRPTTVKTCK
jgi:hypothetical protein